MPIFDEKLWVDKKILPCYNTQALEKCPYRGVEQLAASLTAACGGNREGVACAAVGERRRRSRQGEHRAPQTGCSSGS